MKQQYSNNFWGWHYFDVHTSDGYDIVFTLHNRPFMSLFDVAIFDFFIYHKKRRVLHYFFTRPQNQEIVRQQPFELRFDEQNYIREENGGMTISAHDQRINLQLNLKNCLPPEEHIHLRLPVDGDEYFAWRLLAPQSKAAGSLSWDGRKLSLQGRAYHDRNYGTINLKKALNGWRWAKFFLPGELLIVGEIYFRNREKHCVLARCTEQNCVWTQRVSVERKADRLKIQSDLGAFDLRCKSEQRIDRTDFLISTWPPALRSMEKMRELLAFFTINFKALRPLSGLFTNGRYERYKSLYVADNGHQVQAFQERIFF